MSMAYIWAAIALLAFGCGAVNGTLSRVTSACAEGAESAVKLCLSVGGMMCFWSGLIEIMERSGLAAGLSKALRPLLSRVFPSCAAEPGAAQALSENISANLLGLGNAATPAGIRAASFMKRGNTATDELCLLLVLNTASIQLIPSTIAAVRQSAGAAAPFDIVPAVWLTSAAALFAGLISAALLRRVFK